MAKYYSLPELPFGYKALEPYISEKQLTIHHQKHHQGYVDNTNNILKSMEAARQKGMGQDAKAVLKNLSFNLGGHLLHSLFWKNLLPKKEGGGGMPQGGISETIDEEFGGLEGFKKEFSRAASSVEGSGWAALSFDKNVGRLLLVQIEKHNLNLAPGLPLLMVLDVWEHAYYLDYENRRGDFVDAFWNIVNWKEVEQRLKGIKG